MNHLVFILCTSFHSLGWVLFGYRPSFLQFGPYLSLLLVCGSASVPTTPFRCFYHVTTQLVLARPLLGLPCTFLLFNSCCLVFSTGLILISFWAFLAHFIPLSILNPFHSYILMGFYYIFWASPAQLPYSLPLGFVGFCTNPIC